MIKTVEWTEEGVVMIDQRLLPGEEIYPVFRTYQEVAEAIREMVVRGAPAIGVAAAMGVALGVRDSSAGDVEALSVELEQICQVLAATRPTAVNLFWAIERMREHFHRLRLQGASPDRLRQGVVEGRFTKRISPPIGRWAGTARR